MVLSLLEPRCPSPAAAERALSAAGGGSELVGFEVADGAQAWPTIAKITKTMEPTILL
jgi:hypothetical protein